MHVFVQHNFRGFIYVPMDICNILMKTDETFFERIAHNFGNKHMSFVTFVEVFNHLFKLVKIFFKIIKLIL